MSVKGLLAFPVVIAAAAAAGDLRAAEEFGAAALALPSSVCQAGRGNVSLGVPDAMQPGANPALLAHTTGGEVTLHGGSLFGDGQRTGGIGIRRSAGKLWNVGAFASYHTFTAAEVDIYGENTGDQLGERVFLGGVSAAAGASW